MLLSVNRLLALLSSIASSLFVVEGGEVVVLGFLAQDVVSVVSCLMPVIYVWIALLCHN